MLNHINNALLGIKSYYFNGETSSKKTELKESDQKIKQITQNSLSFESKEASATPFTHDINSTPPSEISTKTEAIVREYAIFGKNEKESLSLEMSAIKEEINALKEISRKGFEITEVQAKDISMKLANLKLDPSLTDDDRKNISDLRKELIDASSNNPKLSNLLNLEARVTDKILEKMTLKPSKQQSNLHEILNKMSNKYHLTDDQVNRETILHQCTSHEVKLKAMEKIIDRLFEQHNSTGYPLSVITTVEKAWSQNLQLIEKKEISYQDKETGGLKTREVTIIVSPGKSAFIKEKQSGEAGGFKAPHKVYDYLKNNYLVALIPNEYELQETQKKEKKPPPFIPVSNLPQKNVGLPENLDEFTMIEHSKSESFPNSGQTLFIKTSEENVSGNSNTMIQNSTNSNTLIQNSSPLNSEKDLSSNTPLEKSEAKIDSQKIIQKELLARGARMRARLQNAQNTPAAAEAQPTAVSETSTLPILKFIEKHPLNKMFLGLLKETEKKLNNALKEAHAEDYETLQANLTKTQELIVDRMNSLKIAKSYKGHSDQEAHLHDISVNLDLSSEPHIMPIKTIIDLKSGMRIPVQPLAGFQVSSLKDPIVDLKKLGELGLEGKLTSEEKKMILKVLQNAAAGIQSVHRKGYIHRDIKAANVLIMADGEGRVSDFGITCKEHGDHGKCNSPGTLTHYSPEIIAYGRTELWNEISTKSDMWSFGVMIHETMMGKASEHEAIKGTPFQMMIKKLEQLVTDPVARQEYEKNYPEPTDKNSIEHLKWRCLRVEPETRPTAEEAALFLDDLIKNS